MCKFVCNVMCNNNRYSNNNLSMNERSLDPFEMRSVTMNNKIQALFYNKNWQSKANIRGL